MLEGIPVAGMARKCEDDRSNQRIWNGWSQIVEIRQVGGGSRRAPPSGVECSVVDRARLLLLSMLSWKAGEPIAEKDASHIFLTASPFSGVQTNEPSR